MRTWIFIYMYVDSIPIKLPNASIASGVVQLTCNEVVVG